MKAAAQKLKVMCLDPEIRGYRPTVRFLDKPIVIVKKHKFLGIIYETEMNFVEHWKSLTSSITARIMVMCALRIAKWGPTQHTMIILHHCYVESKVRYVMMAWYPFLPNNLKKDLNVLLFKSIRTSVGLPTWTKNEALLVESNLDTVGDIAIKTAVSLYTRINPEDTTTMSLAKKHYLVKKLI